jgi:probable rRNA maturation factor
MPETVEPVVEDPRWEEAGIPAVAERAARAALAEAGRDPDLHEVGLLLCDDAKMTELNGSFRGKAGPTNVLSWPAFSGEVPVPPGEPGEGPLFLGDIALGYETCLREAGEAGIPLADHAAHLIVHGVLHLLGHDHGEDAEAEAMEAIETKVLASMGVANPYSA